MYMGRVAALASKHDKLSLIHPPLRDLLGLELRQANIDTDQFGTFSGEIARPSDMVRTAIAKARAGMRELGVPLGFASEGAIGSEGFLPITDLEIVVFVDDEAGFHVAEASQSTDIVARSWVYDHAAPIDEELRRAGFPEHGLIVRLQKVSMGPVFKGIHDRQTLFDAIRQLEAHHPHEIVIESDLRANHCPSRRPQIAAAAERLALRLTHTCPSCDCPGWGEVRKIRGRRCATCDAPTFVMLGHVDGCALCGAERELVVDQSPVDPSNCPYCNP